MHDAPHLSASPDRPRTPFRHAVVLDAEAVGELLPRQPQELCEPLQPLPKVLREELRVRAVRLRESIVLLPPSLDHYEALIQKLVKT